MNAKFLKWETLLIVFVLLLSIHPGLVQAQDGCDPATGQQCDSTPAPTCGLPGQPPCDNGSGSNPNPEPKKIKTLPPPVNTRTFTPTATATSTETSTATPTDIATATIQFAVLMPKVTGTPTSLNEATPTQYFVTFVTKSTPTKMRFVGFSMPAGPGISSNAKTSPLSPLILGIIGALIIIGILWFVKARYFANGSIRENPLIKEQLQDSAGSRNFAKLESHGSDNFMKEVFDDDNSFGDSLRDGKKH